MSGKIFTWCYAAWMKYNEIEALSATFSSKTKGFL